MKKVCVGLIAVVLSGACGSDGGPPTGNQTGTIAGQVVDADSSNGGVSGVSVQLAGPGGNRTATTGANGSFTLTAAATGSWQATLQVPTAYQLAASEAGTRTTNVTGGQTATLTPFRLARPKGQASGTVTESGSAVAGGTVTATRGGFTQQTATPNAQGYTIAGLAVGGWSLAYTPPTTHQLATGETGTRAVTITAGQTATVSAFLLEPAPPQPTVVEISLTGTSFSPSSVTIAAGTTVRWIVVSGQPHTVTPENSSQSGGWQRQEMNTQGQMFEHTFTVAGQTYRYRCEPHSSDFQNGMVGVITVN